ncbi:MAG: nucleotide exchange factor GrpE [Burkholderiales bacterium]|nr:nucleotide exchange factor GrpE [Burkholderiales bacterium]
MQDTNVPQPKPSIENAAAAEFEPQASEAAANEPLSEAALADVENQLQKALDEAAKLKDALLRAVADSDNMRKRAQADVASAHKFALESFSAELLPVKDSLEAALAVENATPESYRNGVELTLKQLANTFGKFNIVEINPAGAKFDPHRHQAIAMVDAEQEANTIVAVVQKGYALNERILRPAMVTVAKPKA